MTVRLELHGRVGLLLLDRPPVNALDTATWLEFDAHIRELEQSTQVRAVVLAAVGANVFSAGADIKEFDDFFEPGHGRAMALRIHDVLNRLEALAKVTIAGVEGAALGGGCELLLACDLRVAGEGASFGFPEVSVGQFPGTGGTMRLPWLIGESRAKELLLTGRSMTADEAFRAGLVHRVVAVGTALEASLAWAQELALLPGSGVAAVKQSVSSGRGADAGERARGDSELSEGVFRSPDAVEGYRAFLEKRAPVFSQPVAKED